MVLGVGIITDLDSLEHCNTCGINISNILPSGIQTLVEEAIMELKAV